MLADMAAPEEGRTPALAAIKNVCLRLELRRLESYLLSSHCSLAGGLGKFMAQSVNLRFRM